MGLLYLLLYIIKEEEQIVQIICDLKIQHQKQLPGFRPTLCSLSLLTFPSLCHFALRRVTPSCCNVI